MRSEETHDASLPLPTVFTSSVCRGATVLVQQENDTRYIEFVLLSALTRQSQTLLVGQLGYAGRNPASVARLGQHKGYWLQVIVVAATKPQREICHIACDRSARLRRCRERSARLPGDER